MPAFQNDSDKKAVQRITGSLPTTVTTNTGDAPVTMSALTTSTTTASSSIINPATNDEKLRISKGSSLVPLPIHTIIGDDCDEESPHSHPFTQPQQPELVVATRVSSTTAGSSLIPAQVTTMPQRHQQQPGSDLILVQANPAKVEDSLMDVLKSRRGRWLCLALIVLVAVVAGGFAIGLYQRKNSSNKEEEESIRPESVAPSQSPSSSSTTLPPTTPPTTRSPTKAPSTMAPTTALEGYLVSHDLLPNYTIPALRNASSPQSKALHWLETTHSNELIVNLTTTPNSRLLQRFALACLYYATNGFGWQFSRYWLSEAHECDWWSHLEIPGAPSSQRVCNDQQQYIALLLDNNILKGTVPPELALLTALQDISLVADSFGVSPQDKKTRFLVGGIPTEYGLYLTNLRQLDISKNALSSSIPSEIGLLSNSLHSLRVLENNMTGSLPKQLAQLTKLQTLFVYDNSFTGPLPSQFGLLAENLLDINAIKNQMTGTIPTELGQLTKMTHLSLQENQFRSTIPSEVGRLDSLTWLLLKHNKLTGNLPPQLGNLKQLRLLYLEHNRFSGTIPTSFGSMLRVKDISLEDNKLIGTIPSELGLLSGLLMIDMTYNTLTGTVPDELCAIPSSGLRYTVNVDCEEVYCNCDCCSSCECEAIP